MSPCCSDVAERCAAAVPTRWRVGLVILGGVLVHLTLGTFYATGNVGPYVISYLRARASPTDATNTLVVWVATLAVGGQGLGMLLGGWLTRRLGPRVATAVGSLLHSCGTALTALSLKLSFGWVMVTYGLMVGLGIGIAYPGPISAAMLWAPSKRGLFSGMILAGFGLGAFVFNPIITLYINPWGYDPLIIDDQSRYFGQEDLLDRVPSCFLVLGLTYASMQTVGCLLISSPPAHSEDDMEMTVVSDDSFDDISAPILNGVGKTTSSPQSSEVQKHTPSKEESSQEEDKEPMAVLRSPLFYALWICFALGAVPVNLISSLYKAYGLVFISDDHFLAGVGSAASVCNAAGRVMWGLVLDRLSIKRTFCLVFLLLGGLTLLLLWQEQIAFAIVVCLVFLSFSGIFVLLPITAATLWGHAHFPINYGLLWFSLVVSTIIASLLGQVLQNALGWTWVFCICTMITILGVAFICFVRGKTAGGEDF